MNPFAKILGILKRFAQPGGRKRLNPSRDWLLVLSLALAAIIASLLWNAWFFFVALNQDSSVSPAPEAKKADTSSLEKARAAFDARAAEEAKYRGEYRFVDPSH